MRWVNSLLDFYHWQAEDLVLELRLQPRVHFTGFHPNPYPYLAHADLFVLSSRYEGLPNALIEAIALGCPVIALDRPGGTREILEHARARNWDFAVECPEGRTHRSGGGPTAGGGFDPWKHRDGGIIRQTLSLSLCLYSAFDKTPFAFLVCPTIMNS